MPLEGCPRSPVYQAEVDRYYADPELNKNPVEHSLQRPTRGLANWMVETVADETDADIGFSISAACVFDSIPAGDVGAARIYDLEPGTEIALMRMTLADMCRMIVSKHNDEGEPQRRPPHRPDLDDPYVIRPTPWTTPLDVRFPGSCARAGVHEVAVSDYVYKNYKGPNYTDGNSTV